ncbi:hypothetical protein J132_02288 [Termitomyces sp. J132]|nr:hypothetical protein J132_02288 [Termitomyces sp. J132]
MPDIKKMAIDSANKCQDPLWFPSAYGFQPVMRLKASWEQFIDSLTKEWKTLNLVSVLLLSAILTTLQIDGALTDPYTRYLAFLALVTHKAAEWAEEAQKTKTFIWWNVWVLLAMPAIWLSWSIVLYSACVLTFVWRTGTTSDSVLQITPLAALGPRLAVTLTFILGLIYLCLIIREFRRYGVVMDKAWRERLLEWTRTSQTMHGDTFKGRSSPDGHESYMEEKAFPNKQGPSPWGVGSWGVDPVVPPSFSSVQTSHDPLKSLGPFVSPPWGYTQTSVNPSQLLGPRPLDLLHRFPERDRFRTPLETVSEISMEPDSTSGHSLQSGAGVVEGEIEGEDENSPVDEDGHGERVASSYPQSDLLSQGARQPDQHDLCSAEYNLNNLAGRPKDWRWDYGVRRTIDPGTRTSIDGAFRSAPLLSNQSQLTSVLFLNRIQRPNRTYNFSNPFLRPLKHVCHVRSALRPGLTNALFPNPWTRLQLH